MRFILTYLCLITFPISIYSQCTLTIEPDATLTGCMESHSKAQFTDLVRTALVDNTIKKTSGYTSWNGGAFSTSGITENGYVQTVITQTNKTRIFGLSHSNNSNSNQINDVEYAVVLRSWGGAEIRESGSYKAYAGNYSVGDTMKISVEDGEVRYFRNSSLLYTSGNTPNLPLFIDLAFQHVGGEFSDTEIVQTTGTTIRAFATGDYYELSPCNWYQNNTLLEETGSEITLSSFSAGDIISCEGTLLGGNCAGESIQSNLMIINPKNNATGSDFYISSAPTDQGCFLACEAVRWKANIPGNIEIGGSEIRKINGYNTSNGGIFSINKIANNGYLEFQIGETNKRKMLGLSTQDDGNQESGIQYAFYIEGGNNIRIYENGQWKGAFGSVSTSDKLRIAVEDDVVKYYKNVELLYVSEQEPVLPLIADGTIQDIGGRFKGAVISNQSQGRFIASTGESVDPTLHWKINGQSTGETGTTLTVDALAENDVITCSYISTEVGCGNLNVESNSIEIKPNTHISQHLFYISGIPESGNIGMAEEEVIWNPASLMNVSNIDNHLTKIQGYNQFNAGASSLNTVKNNGYFKYRVTETNKKKALGLSSSDPNFNYSSTDYAMVLNTNGKFTIYESGSWRLGNQSYQNGDLLRIAVENSTVKYYRNQTLVYTSGTSPSLPLLVDVSLSNEGATVSNAVVGNPNEGKFIAHVSGLGDSPALEWKVNGNPIGIHSDALNYDQIEDGDIITCTITPDFSGCGSTAEFESNRVKYSGPPSYTEWIGIVSSGWNNTANWSYGVPSMDLSAKIPNGRPHQPIVSSTAYVDDIEVESGATLSITNAASLLVYGDFSNMGTFHAGNGKLSFNGSGNRKISGNNLTFNKLIINLSEPDSKIGLLSSISIAKETIFVRGKIIANNQEVIYLNGSNSREGNRDSYIVGTTRKIGNTAFKFPIGSGSVFAPIEITAPQNSTDAFTAEYFYDDPNNAGYSPEEQDGTIQTISSCEYWVLDRVVGQSAVSVSLSFENERSCGIADPSFLQVLHWNGTEWENMGMKSIDGTGERGTITSRNPISEFSPFTLGSTSGLNPLPIELSAFEATKKGRNAQLNWITESEKNNAYFTIERSKNARNFHKIGKINGAGTSRQNLSYQYVDPNPAEGINYYRLSQTDYDGRQTFFDIQSVYFKSNTGLAVYPNPNKGSFQIQRQSSSQAELCLRDMFGKIRWQYKTDQSHIRINVAELPKGVYFLEVNDGKSTSEKVIIQ